MKKLYLFILAILMAFPVFSQLEKGYVHLKNGNVIKGKYQYSEGKIHIVSAGSLWIFDVNDVDTIMGTRVKNMQLLQEPVSESSVFYRIEAGLLIGNSQNSQSAPFSFTGSVNYRVEPRFSLGIGVGTEFYKESYLPVFANFEYKLKENFSAPYLFLRLGYEVALEDGGAVYYDVYPAWSSSIWRGYYYGQELNAKGGVFVNPGIGLTHMFSTTFGMSVAVGYQFHRLQYDAQEERDYGLDIDYNRLTVKIGILFN